MTGSSWPGSDVARVSSTCLATVARNRYSLPCELAGQMLSTRLYPTRVVVVADDMIVADHQRLMNKGKIRYDWRHYVPLLDLIEQNNGELEGSRWLVEQMLRAETTERATRSVGHQMSSAKFPVHRDLAGFDFEASPVDRKLVMQLAETTFTEAAHNVVLVGGPGTGKSHLGTAIGVAGFTRHGKRGALLLDGGVGQRARAGKGPRQSGTHRRQHAAAGRGHPR